MISQIILLMSWDVITPLRCDNSLSRSNNNSTHFGIESIINVTAKICNKMPNEVNKVSSLTDFKSKFIRVVLYFIVSIAAILWKRYYTLRYASSKAFIPWKKEVYLPFNNYFHLNIEIRKLFPNAGWDFLWKL